MTDLKSIRLFIFFSIVGILTNAQGVSAEETVLFNNDNIASVTNGPSNPTVFELDHPTYITFLSNYHWNFGQGAVPGTIELRGDTGEVFGPWAATPRDGQNNVSNANWDVFPNIVIPAGRYTVVDSDPSSWSQNGGSNASGFTMVHGVPLPNQPDIEPNVSPVTLFDNNNIGGVSNAPGSPTSFTLAQSALITFISNYHWNFGAGAEPGTITLRNEQGTLYGPWQTTPRAGQNNNLNANWDAKPYVIIPPGTYTVIDSDPATWSQNAGSNHEGFSNIQGFLLGDDSSATLTQIELALGLEGDWISHGDASWFPQSTITHQEGSALQSGAIGHNQVSRLSVTLNGPGDLSFYWKTSSEGADLLRCFMDGNPVANISGETDWQEVRIPIRWGVHTLSWEYRKDGSVDTGADAAWLDSVSYLPVDLISLEEALPQAPRPIESSEDNPWFGQKTLTYQNQPVAQTGNIRHNQSTRMSMTVEGPGTLNWVWRASSEAADRIRLLDGETVVSSISGETDWIEEDIPLRWGTHHLSWEYAKDGSVDSHQDAGWVAAINYSPVALIDLPMAVNYPDSTWTTDEMYPWFGQGKEFYQVSGYSAQSGNITHNQECALTTHINGPAHLIFHWKASTEQADRCTFSINGMNVSSISGETDWQQLVYYLDEGVNELTWTYRKDGNTDSGLDAVWLDNVRVTSTDSILPIATTPPPSGGTTSLRSSIGQVFLFDITGQTQGGLWGTTIYTDDSTIAKAAVHAGILLPGESGIVKVIILPGQTSYEGSENNGVQSLSYGAWTGSFRVEHYSLQPPTPVELDIQKTDTGYTVTWDSDNSEYNLLSTPSLTPPVIWDLAPGTHESVNGRHTFHVPVDPSSPYQFFFLRP